MNLYFTPDKHPRCSGRPIKDWVNAFIPKATTTETELKCPTCFGHGGGSDAAGSPFAPGVWFGQGEWVDCPACEGGALRTICTKLCWKRKWWFDRVAVSYRTERRAESMQSYRAGTIADAASGGAAVGPGAL